ncbi:Acg family FMN-binding oxidoreductase [Actinokineospora bangkokensis]|uniref:Acg family FMN-binding oxidoreductase n=1 Tax=Actinokineospora bangkokensis TaxID=1193682 RepID=UPI0038BD44E8
MHNTQPWRLWLRGRDASVLERVDVRLPRHDPVGRDRLISCGAAVANLRLAVRRLGWSERVVQFPDPAHPAEVARVVAGVALSPDEAELALYRAIRDRASHRAPFGVGTVAEAVVHRLTAPTALAGVRVSVVRLHECDQVARSFHHAALVHRADSAYQRELAAWGARGGDDGVVEPGASAALPWAGLVRRRTAVPDERVLSERLADEVVLVVSTVGDGRSDHLHAGMAMERVWLTATALGLAASVVTQPLHLPEVRRDLVEGLGLDGYPQVLLRVGYPGVVPERSPRRSFTDLLASPGPA